MDKIERRKYVLAQLNSLPNAFQYVEVSQYIEDLEQQLQKKQDVIDKAVEYLKKEVENLTPYEIYKEEIIDIYNNFISIIKEVG